MAIIRANELGCAYTRQDIIDGFCNKLMEDIKMKNATGRNKTVFYVCGGYWDAKNKEFTYKDNGEQYHNWDDYENEIEKLFVEAGYIIKPTGYIGGVWQLTKDIMW